MKKLIPILLCFLGATNLFAQYTWDNKNNFSSNARFKSGEFVVNGKGYVVGGRTSTSPLNYVKDTWEYNPATDSWTQKSNFTYAMVQPATFSIGSKGYVVGGQNSSFVYVNDTYEYDPASDTWTAKADFPESGVGGCFEFVINGKAYVGGGARNSSQPSTSMYEYNPTTNAWTQKASYPGSPSVNPIAFSIGNFGYAGSGTDGAGNLNKEFYKYDPSNDTWTAIATFPGKERFEAMAFVVDGLAFVGGGARLLGSSSYFSLNDMYAYNPTTNTWSPAPSLPGTPKAHGANFSINNTAYLVNGYDYDGDIYYNNVSELGTCYAISNLNDFDNSNNNSFLIYPNPASSEFNVRVQNGFNGELKYEVFGIDGKLVKLGVSQEDMFKFSVSDLSNGVYLIRLIDDAGQTSVKRFEVIH
jgi:N-acetylneuraminic acid mutarotase